MNIYNNIQGLKKTEMGKRSQTQKGIFVALYLYKILKHQVKAMNYYIK